MSLSTWFFRRKINTKNRVPNILTVVPARKAWAYNSLFLRCTNNTVAITMSVSTAMYANNIQNLGIIYALCPVKISNTGGKAISNKKNR